MSRHWVQHHFELEPLARGPSFKQVKEKLAVTAINPQLGQLLSAEEFVALAPAIENLRDRWPNQDEKAPGFDELFVAITENVKRFGFGPLFLLELALLRRELRERRVAGLPGYKPQQETR